MKSLERWRGRSADVPLPRRATALDESDLTIYCRLSRMRER